MAVAMAYGPEAGLVAVDALSGAPALENYHLMPGVRGYLLARLGRGHEAAAKFRRAASLTRNQREQALMLSRAAACEADPAGGKG